MDGHDITNDHTHGMEKSVFEANRNMSNDKQNTMIWTSFK